MRHIMLGMMALLLLGACGKKSQLDVPPGGAEDSRVEREWDKNRDKY